MSAKIPDGTTGKILEEEYFGRVMVGGEKAAAAQKVFMELSGGQTPEQARGRLPFMSAVRFAKAVQPWQSPTLPKRKVARDLLDFVCEDMGIDPESEEAEHLEFYTSVGSPLDLHGVDAFIEYRGVRALIDVTKNPAKRFDDSSGDRMIMEELPDWNDPSQKIKYEQELRKYSKHLAMILSEAIEKRRERERAYVPPLR
ncbi:hypothetical protein HZB94_02035 [Candidatus Falkowbacteria bacterium]|nr:hypothetical protein [Candidatus Falkowbacteria bacterium]